MFSLFLTCNFGTRCEPKIKKVDVAPTSWKLTQTQLLQGRFWPVPSLIRAWYFSFVLHLLHGFHTPTLRAQNSIGYI